MPTFSGYRFMPVDFARANPEFFIGDEGFQNAFNAMVAAYTPRFGGSSLYNWLQNAGGFNAARDAFSTMEADLWRQGRGEETPDYMSFFSQMFNPLQAFSALTPGARGENPAAFSPFTVFRRR